MASRRCPRGSVGPSRAGQSSLWLRQRGHHRSWAGMWVGRGPVLHCSAQVPLWPAPWTWVCHKRVSSVPGTFCTATVNKAISINPDMRCTCALKIWAALAPLPSKAHWMASRHTSCGPIRDIPEGSLPAITGDRADGQLPDGALSSQTTPPLGSPLLLFVHPSRSSHLLKDVCPAPCMAPPRTPQPRLVVWMGMRVSPAHGLVLHHDQARAELGLPS